MASYDGHGDAGPAPIPTGLVAQAQAPQTDTAAGPAGETALRTGVLPTAQAPQTDTPASPAGATPVVVPTAAHPTTADGLSAGTVAANQQGQPLPVVVPV